MWLTFWFFFPFRPVYTRPAPKNVASSITSALIAPRQPPAPALAETTNEVKAEPPPEAAAKETTKDTADLTPSPMPPPPPPTTLPLNSISSPTITSGPSLTSSFSSLPALPANLGTIGSLDMTPNSHVMHETLNVINEHITDLSTEQSNGFRNGGDSSSEYSSHIDHRLSYIQGEETDEEEESTHSRAEVESWSADEVAEFLFTSGVEKHHCEVFRDQEITGEVLLGMDQTSLFIKAFDLGPVGRRLKTWQKIKTLQDEVNGSATRRTTLTYGSEAGSDAARTRSRTNTLTNSISKHPSLQGRRSSISQTPRMDPTQLGSPVSPLADSPSRTRHEKRPSAASIRDLHHSRRHSSTDFRSAGPTPNASGPPKLMNTGTFPILETTHKKQPSFDRNWTLGNAASFGQRPQSSAGYQDGTAAAAAAAAAGTPTVPEAADLQDSAVDLDRGYFSGPDADSKRRNVLRKRDSLPGGHAQTASYAEEQRIRSGTALSRHSRFGSDTFTREPPSPSSNKFYGMGTRRTASNATSTSIRPVAEKDASAPAVTRLDTGSSLNSRDSNKPTAVKRLSQINHPDFNVNMLLKSPFSGRSASDAFNPMERNRMVSPAETSLKDMPLYSPSRAGSSTPSGGPSFELDSPDAAKNASTAAAAAAAAANRKAAKTKTKKETSAYTRGLQKLSPREAVLHADYSGWMKKKSSNLMTTWKPRLFVLKGRRLAYYYSEDDTEEKGLIDISFHRVLPADNERLTSLHATLTGASATPTVPADSHVQTLAATQAEKDPTVEADSIFIFKLVPPRAGLSRAVNFTKPTVHYFAVPNIKQGRLWMAALMKATIDRDDTQPITTTYQAKTISLAKARQMRHRPPSLLGDDNDEKSRNSTAQDGEKSATGLSGSNDLEHDLTDLEKLGLQKIESARSRGFNYSSADKNTLPQSA